MSDAIVRHRASVYQHTPPIAWIGWVSELVKIAGGIDIFADGGNQGAAKDRVVTAEDVVAREPDPIIGSWCGKKFRPERVVARPGFDRIPAVQHQDVYEIKSSLILQPGPAALTKYLKGHKVNSPAVCRIPEFSQPEKAPWA